MKKKIKTLIVCLALAFTLGSVYTIDNLIDTSALEETYEEYYVKTNSNIRSGPSVKYDKVGLARKGSTVLVVEQSKTGWYKIKFNDGYAYICNSLVCPINEVVVTNDNTATTTTNAVVDENSIEGQILKLVNDHRASVGAPALTMDSNLVSVAAVRASELPSAWSHTRPDGRKFSTAFQEKGIKYSYIGENLAMSFTDAQSAVDAWLNSPGHKASIEDAEFTRTGIAIYTDENGTMYAAQEFMN